MEKDEYWLWLGTIPGIGNVTALKLLNAFGGDIRVLYEADKKTIAGRHIVSEKLYIVETGTESAVPMHR